MNNIRISPSLMTMDLDKFQEQLTFLNSRVDSYHIDIMDGHFVPNLALSPWFMEEVRKVSDLPLSAHVMAIDPTFWTNELIKARADVICLHAEVLNGLAFRLSDQIHNAGLDFGVVLNPETPVSTILPYLDEVQKVTLMTVDPGFAGQRFLPGSLEKVGELRTLREERGLNFDIEIDGSFNEKSFVTITDAQADIYIIGRSGLFGIDESIESAWEAFTEGLVKATGLNASGTKLYAGTSALK